MKWQTKPLLLTILLALFAAGCGPHSSASMPQYHGAPGWLSAGSRPPRAASYPTPPPSPHLCSAKGIAPGWLQQQSGFHQFSVELQAPADAAPPTLTAGDIRLFDTATSIPIVEFARDPATIGILVDTSGSMGMSETPWGEPVLAISQQPNADKLTRAVAAISVFLTKLEARDDIFLYAFNSNPYLLQPLTFDRDLASQKLSVVRAGGETSMYDALTAGLQTLQAGCFQRKALLWSRMERTTRALIRNGP